MLVSKTVQARMKWSKLGDDPLEKKTYFMKIFHFWSFHLLNSVDFAFLGENLLMSEMVREINHIQQKTFTLKKVPIW